MEDNQHSRRQCPCGGIMTPSSNTNDSTQSTTSGTYYQCNLCEKEVHFIKCRHVFINYLIGISTLLLVAYFSPNILSYLYYAFVTNIETLSVLIGIGMTIILVLSVWVAIMMIIGARTEQVQNIKYPKLAPSDLPKAK